jgi:hypothetical protein
MSEQRRLFRPRDCSDVRARELAGNCFAGARSEQSGCSADAVAHPIRVNERARVQAEHDRVKPLDLLWTGFLVADTERAIDRVTAPARHSWADPQLVLLDGL